MIRLVVFDLDDTLYPERDFVMSGFGAVAAFINHKTAIDEERILSNLLQLFESGVRANIFERLVEKMEIDFHPHEITDLVKIYREQTPLIQLDEQAQNALGILKKFHTKIAVIAEGYRSVESGKIEMLGLNEVVDEVIYSDYSASGCHEPSERPLREAIERLAIESDEVLFVAENTTKLSMVKCLGINTARLRMQGRSHFDVEVEEKEKADFEIRSLVEVTNVLKELALSGKP